MEDSNDNEFIERFEENDFKDFISNKLPEEINLKYHKLDSNNRLMNRNVLIIQFLFHLFFQ